MSFFRKILGGTTHGESDPDIRFGRYSDAYKSDAKYDAWDASMDLFEEGKYVESFTRFFDYLTDEHQGNVKTEINGDVLKFELLQGSKMIRGEIDSRMIRAEAKVARTEALSIGFLRRMMEQNYTLKYSRFALDTNNDLTLKFESYLLDGSPYKLYYALKEIAVSADKQDDLLVLEFDALQPINTGHLQHISGDEKQIKTTFLRDRITQVLKDIDTTKLSPDQHAGGIGYLLLDLAYRLDYLIKPEGALMEAFERIHRIYFAQDDKTPIEKNAGVRKEFEKILEKTDEEIKAELYNASASFGITSPSSHEQLVNFIDGELPHMDWYADNKHYHIALAITGYITGYGFFNYAFVPPAKQLLHFYYRLTEPQYFKDLGFEGDYLTSDGKVDKRAVRSAMHAIEDQYKGQYPKIKIDMKALDFSSMPSFAKSYFRMIRNLDMSKKVV